MYCQHFNLNKKPFQLSSDNAFLWLGDKHAQALDALKRGIEGDSGLVVLTGDVGTGKTTLIHEIIHTLPPGTACSHITDPSMELHHLFSILADDLGFDGGFDAGEKMMPRLQAYLTEAERGNRNALVIIDEAHLIPVRFLKELVSWSKLSPGRVFTILLAGQLEFHQVLENTLGRSWKDRVDVHAMLAPLDEQETKTYINRRLELAGARRKIFIVAAVRQIHTFSKGIPRRINMACDQAMIAAFSKDMKIIDVPTLNEALGILDLPVRDRAPENQDNGQSSPSVKIAAGLALLTISGFVAYTFYIRQPDIFQAPPIISAPLPDKTKADKTKTEKTVRPTPEPEQIEHAKPEQAASLPETPPSAEIHPSPEILPEAPARPNLLPEDVPEFYSPPEEDEFPAVGETQRDEPGPDLEDFIYDVFMVRTTDESMPEPPETSERNAEGSPKEIEPPLTPPEHGDKRAEEPDPRAVIDWLLEKKATR